MNVQIDTIIKNFPDINLNEKIDIVYSVTVHESIECVIDLIYNICYFNKQNKIIIILHPNDLIYEKIKLISMPNFVMVNNKPSIKSRCTYSIMKAHIENFNYIKHYDFEIFCLIASNCMFVKHVCMDKIRNIVKPIAQYNQQYKHVDITNSNIDIFMKNDKILDVFKTHNIAIKKYFHEGSVFRYDVFEQIIQFIETANIEANIKYEFVAEEILLASVENFITNTNAKRICTFVNGHLPKTKDINNIIADPYAFVIKKIPRTINHRARLLVHQLYKS